MSRARPCVRLSVTKYRVVIKPRNPHPLRSVAGSRPEKEEFITETIYQVYQTHSHIPKPEKSGLNLKMDTLHNYTTAANFIEAFASNG